METLEREVKTNTTGEDRESKLVFEENRDDMESYILRLERHDTEQKLKKERLGITPQHFAERYGFGSVLKDTQYRCSELEGRIAEKV
ncbi:hypothetical protein CHS0354_008869 [Potamilus streckersoni]|uniref:Uncharacterized protein n=1 Tax=Potamilus streckersoni TaxID=2493646 RepID=A0AAE0RU97_9BIVA|nr:hypothetical protein CHS0354_008869 [Potamilus streckersoni]